MINYSKRMGLLVTAAILGMTGQALAATTLSVAVNGSRYMEASGITRLAVGNPEIADVRLLSGNDFLLVGKKARFYYAAGLVRQRPGRIQCVRLRQ